MFLPSLAQTLNRFCESIDKLTMFVFTFSESNQNSTKRDSYVNKFTIVSKFIIQYYHYFNLLNYTQIKGSYKVALVSGG
jgi:hypothetical protein